MIYDLVSKRGYFFLISAIAIVPGLISLVLPGGLRPGIDFTAGSILTVRFESPPAQSDVRQAMANLGHPEAVVQTSDDNTFIVRTMQPEAETPADAGSGQQPSERQRIEDELTKRFGSLTVLSFDQVSPIIATEIVRNSVLAV